ncbi:AAA family ATPase [Flexivirga sp. ID2601S]|uniref:Nuclease SbcCD subunit C n=1 Tax=Flexivirga aerilata TaxID=1656889 RepID=A0A849ALF0_9MICO|nr:AAA family ATPase [Flexivirga aerilata]NNG40913.1 AAA family ATPase [Flexivirga aerilata]
MKLHHLRVQAFGPFGGVEEIDFDDLGAAGLHLIHGPTGSGKTSLLDAICFALFAGVPGARQRHRGSLRSDHAAPETRPEVELEFSVGTRRLRVRRSPDHEVPKKRGTGTRMQRASVVLEERHDGGWTTSATRADEAAQVIDDLLGMALEQFAQVVLLPQGDFAAFLRAKPDERGKLLERLFDITDFRDIEDWLVEHRKQLETAVRAADSRRMTLLARAQEHLVPVGFTGADDVPEDPSDAGTVDPDAGALDLDAVTAELAARSTTSLAAADAARGAADAAREVLDERRALAALQRQASQAAATLARLDAQSEATAAAATRVALAERASRAAPVVAAATRRAKAAASAAADLAAARRSLAAVTAWPVPALDTDQLPDRLDAEQTLAAIRERRAAGDVALGGYAELNRQLARHRRDVERARSDAAGAEDRAAERQRAVNAATERVEQQRAQRAEHAEIAATVGDLQVRHRALERFGTMLAGARRAIADVRAHDQELQAARETWVHAEGHAIRLRARRLSGIAAELAGGLRDGRPCPVCGSQEHPEPAAADDDAVSADEVDTAEQECAHARALVDDRTAIASAAQGAARAAVDEVLAGCGDAVEFGVPNHLRDTLATHDLSGDALPTVLAALDELERLRAPAADQAAAGLAAAQAAQRTVTRLDQVIEAARQHLEIDGLELAEAREASAAARARVAELRAAVDAAEARLREMRADHENACGCLPFEPSTHDLPDVIGGHDRCADLLDALLAAAGQHELARGEAATAHADLTAALGELGFDSADDVAASQLPTTELRALADQVEAAQLERAKATGVLEQADVAAAAAADPADVAGAEHVARTAEHTAKAARDEAAAIERAHTAVQRIAAEYAEAERESAPLRARLAVATNVAAAVTGGGDNVLRMRLTSYVLAARLETVTALANEKLAVMTDGRYSLEHTDALAARGGKSGLGLRVRDAWTGQTRDTATLSGGESFMASLALALGLGEAVIEAAGGRHLETLLVDEGFGSLDDETLELVMTVLDQLRAGGRSVGVVSHVPELRTRIPAQVRVRKTATGSTVEVSRADAEVA